MNNLIKCRKIIASFIAATLLIQACSVNPGERSITRSGFFFDTLINITVYDTDDEHILDLCFDMCNKYEHLLSITVQDSDIFRINEAGTDAVSVSSETIDLITDARKYYTLSDGMLDITIAPLSTLWTEARKNGIPPSAEKINALLPHVNINNITVDADRCIIKKEDPNTMLDTGSLAKGYIADRLKELLIENGVHSAIISLGGNIMTIGDKPDGSPFRIGIKQPFGEASQTAASLKVTDMSVVTSGIYERCFSYDDKLYHHILDPVTGYPKDTDLYSATIISSSSTQGDALSTICLLCGLDKAEALINNTPDVEAVFITRDYKLHYTEGAVAFVDQTFY
ncbi:MAG: FAD:protein FMN transferase [Lachnospiraceae bacterium]|nr:FAD:protein FMN transferase [Lachnospiraceae bacterium]